MEEKRLYEMYLNEAIEERRIDLLDKNLKYKNLKSEFDKIMNEYPNLQNLLEENIRVSLDEGECKMLQKLINIYMIFVKTLNEKNLLQGTKNIRQRAKELLDHFEWLQSNDRILQHVNSFNAKTAMDITTQSLNLNSAKQILTYDRLATLTGTAFMGYTVDIIQKIEEKNPKQKEQLNLPIVSEENENVEDDKNSFF